MFQEKEYDYSLDAQRKVHRINRMAEILQRRAKAAKTGKSWSDCYNSAKKHEFRNNRRIVLELLRSTMNSETLEERRGMWKETKFLMEKFGIEISFSMLRKLVKVWYNHATLMRVTDAA